MDQIQQFSSVLLTTHKPNPTGASDCEVDYSLCSASSLEWFEIQDHVLIEWKLLCIFRALIEQSWSKFHADCVYHFARSTAFLEVRHEFTSLG